MNTLRFIAVAATVFAAAASHASSDPAYDQYRRVVLGDSSVAAPAQDASASSGRVMRLAGPYGQHLIANGQSADSAIADARRIGEAPDFRWVKPEVARQPLNAFAAHEKSLGKSDYATRSTDTASAE